MKLLQRVTIVVFVLVALAFGGTTFYHLLFVDDTPPVITSSSDVIETSVSASEEALLAGVTAADNQDGDLTDQIIVQSVTPLITSDTAKVTYIVFDSSNNMASLARTIRYTDYEKPLFELAQPLVFQVGETVTLLDRLTARDVLDGDITDNIRVTSQNIAIQYEGTYQITVQATNSMGDTASLPLKVIISNSASKQLIRLTDYIVYLDAGEEFDPADYIRSVKNPDSTSADPSGVQIDHQVDTQTPGTYDVLYTYTAQGQTYAVYLTVVIN